MIDNICSYPYSKLHCGLEIYQGVADDILSGRRTFDIQPIFESIQVGDLIQYNCIERGMRISKSHAINHRTYEVVYVSHDIGIERNYCIIGLREYRKAEDKSE